MVSTTAWTPLLIRGSVAITKRELCIETTLACGQSFRWKRMDNISTSTCPTFACVLGGNLVAVKQDNDPASSTAGQVFFKTFKNRIKPSPSDNSINNIKEVHALLHSYFALDVQLDELYSQWNSDPNFKSKAGNFRGVRILDQCPVENIFCFICSSNNNIARIEQMIDKMSARFGKSFGFIHDEPGLDNPVLEFYSFPTIETLASDPKVEQILRELGFGYRAKYIAQTARILEGRGGIEWCKSLRSLSYPETKQALLELSGVGPKVADCIALMSCQKHGSIPVDTHVWQIAVRDYRFVPKSKTKSLTAKTYDEIGDKFRSIFGEYAGWAHSVLFAADLRKFQDRGNDDEETQLREGEAPPTKRMKK